MSPSIKEPDDHHHLLHFYNPYKIIITPESLMSKEELAFQSMDNRSKFKKKVFEQSYLYMGLISVTGCSINLQLTFPETNTKLETVADLRKKKNQSGKDIYELEELYSD